MLIFWVLLIFRIINVGLIILVTRKRLTYHAAITDGIACRPLNYEVWNAFTSEHILIASGRIPNTNITFFIFGLFFLNRINLF